MSEGEALTGPRVVVEVLSAGQVGAIHHASLGVLEHTGVYVEDPEALDILGDGGCDVDRGSRMVKLPPHVVEDALASCPERVLLAGRTREHDVWLEAGGPVRFTNFDEGIRTFPFQVAQRYKIPLIVWGEHGFAELTGMVSLEDFVEFTHWTRKEHDMRGIEATDIVGEDGITAADIEPLVWPGDEDLATGIYLSNFVEWNALEQAQLMMREWDFAPVTYPRERTFVQYTKIEDHANDIHDYLKFLKFGYGRATDDASMEIRHGRMTRAEGIEMVRHFDPVAPSTLDAYCDFLGMSWEEFYDHPQIDVAASAGHPPVDGDEVKQSRTRTFDNPYLYRRPGAPVLASGDPRLDALGEFVPI